MRNEVREESARRAASGAEDFLCRPFGGKCGVGPQDPVVTGTGLTSRNCLSHQTCYQGARLAFPGVLEQIAMWELGKLELNPSSALYWLCDIRQVAPPPSVSFSLSVK